MRDIVKPVREGEELDMESLAPLLAQWLPELDPGAMRVEQFGAGHSNLTYLLTDEGTGRQLVLRRPPRGANIKSGHDMSREYQVMRALGTCWDKVPKMYGMCEDGDLIGAPFYVMERVEGVILRGPQPRGVELPEPMMRLVCESLLDTLIEIHGLDLARCGLQDFGRPEGYIERQVSGWTRRWEASRTDTIEGIDQAAAWLATHLPEEQPATLIHNDFKYDNVILDPDDLAAVRAVLDWEMATLGDPLMDLGTSLAYWIEPEDPEILQGLRFGPTTLPGNLTRRELVQRYGALTGRDTSQILFHYVYGLFKVAVVGQQIYARYKKGLTRDERFAGLIFAVQALGDAATRAIDTGRIGA